MIEKMKPVQIDRAVITPKDAARLAAFAFVVLLGGAFSGWLAGFI